MSELSNGHFYIIFADIINPYFIAEKNSCNIVTAL